MKEISMLHISKNFLSILFGLSLFVSNLLFAADVDLSSLEGLWQTDSHMYCMGTPERKAGLEGEDFFSPFIEMKLAFIFDPLSYVARKKAPSGISDDVSHKSEVVVLEAQKTAMTKSCDSQRLQNELSPMLQMQYIFHYRTANPLNTEGDIRKDEFPLTMEIPIQSKKEDFATEEKDNQVLDPQNQRALNAQKLLSEVLNTDVLEPKPIQESVEKLKSVANEQGSDQESLSQLSNENLAKIYKIFLERGYILDGSAIELQGLSMQPPKFFPDSNLKCSGPKEFSDPAVFGAYLQLELHRGYLLEWKNDQAKLYFIEDSFCPGDVTVMPLIRK